MRYNSRGLYHTSIHTRFSVDSKVKRGLEPQNTQSEPILLRGRYCKTTHHDGFSSSHLLFLLLDASRILLTRPVDEFRPICPFSRPICTFLQPIFSPVDVQFIFWYTSDQETSYSITTDIQAESEFGLEEYV